MKNTDTTDIKSEAFSKSGDSYAVLADDLQQLRKDFKMLREDLTSLGAAGVDDAKETVKDGLNSTEKQAREALESAASEFEEIQRQTESAIRKTPLKAVFTALAIGYFAGGLMRK